MASKLLRSIKDLIRSELQKRNWSERELAIKAGVTPATINELLKSEDKDLRVSTLEDIAKALGMEAWQLLRGGNLEPSSIEKRLEALERVAFGSENESAEGWSMKLQKAVFDHQQGERAKEAKVDPKKKGSGS